jgi:hypothetical protein
MLISVLIAAMATAGCSQRLRPDITQISTEEARNLRFSRISVDISGLTMKMSNADDDILTTSIRRSLEKRFRQQMGKSNYRIIVHLKELSLRMPPAREHEQDENDYIDGDAYILGSDDQILVRKRVLLALTGANNIVPWPTLSFRRKQLTLLGTEYGAWVHRELVGGPAT